MMTSLTETFEIPPLSSSWVHLLKFSKWTQQKKEGNHFLCFFGYSGASGHWKIHHMTKEGHRVVPLLRLSQWCIAVVSTAFDWLLHALKSNLLKFLTNSNATINIQHFQGLLCFSMLTLACIDTMCGRVLASHYLMIKKNMWDWIGAERH